jgi:hydroxymethylbilane synthase
VLRELGGGCMIPMAAWGRDLPGSGTDVDLLALDAAIFDPDGQTQIRVSLTGRQSTPDALGHQAAQALRAQGADSLLRRICAPRV